MLLGNKLQDFAESLQHYIFKLHKAN